MSNPYKCKFCPEENPDNFYDTNKSSCKKCIIANKPKYVKRLPKPKMAHLCKECGEDDPTLFPTKKKSKCKACYSIYKRTTKSHYTQMSDDEKALMMKRKIAWADANFFKHIICQINARCRKKPYSSELTFEFLEELFEKQQGRCYLSGAEMVKKTVEWNAASVDRRDSSLGYTETNVGLCCAKLNRMKLDLEEYEFIALCKAVADYN